MMLRLLAVGFFASLLVVGGCDNLTGDEGNRGPAGFTGAAGEPCIVTDHLDGTFTQTCPGGGAVTFGDTEEPDAYANANGARGGQLYDNWWTVTGADEPLRLSRRSYALRLLQYVRDEAHRFAQHYHHILRRRSTLGQ